MATVAHEDAATSSSLSNDAFFDFCFCLFVIFFTLFNAVVLD